MWIPPPWRSSSRPVAGPACTSAGMRRICQAKTWKPGGPSWNGKPLTEVFPWGAIRTPTTAANERTAAELSKEEADHIRRRTAPLLATFDYA